jgi:hypothetical protein
MTLSPYLISLQLLALESELQGYNALARGARGLLVKETLQTWLSDRPPMPDLQAWPEPPEQTSLEGNQ